MPSARKMLMDIEQVLTKVADESDLYKMRPITIEFLKKILRAAQQGNKGDARK